MKRLFRFALVAGALAVAAAPAFAHTTVSSTSPASGSILPASPPEVTINFHEAARMTSIVVIAPSQPDRKLEFMPSGSSMSFMVHDPALGMGRNEIQWKALSKDGHVISGSIIVVIKPGAPASSPAPTQPHEHHDGGEHGGAGH